jgi:tetratricopeptide (TPR) repeat protein
MSKVALLIGVSEYQSAEFQDLAAAERDVAAMRDVLVQPGIGGFAEVDVTVLLNPKPQLMREALDRLFAERKSDDLVVLYFSGHGVVDDGGKFHLTTAQTDKGLLNSTAIPAIFVHGLMEGSRSKQQVLILDCCFSGAFAKGMVAKGDAVNLQPQLGGRGRAVLTSSSAVEYSFEQKESALSIYTQYVVEGLRTGIADEGGDGWISVDELHRFAQAKVREATPVMQPKIYAVEEGYKIILAQAPMGDPKLEYRKEVEQWAKKRNGQLSATVLLALETKQQQLGLASNLAIAIRQEVCAPYKEFEAKVQRYQQALQSEIQPGNKVNLDAWEDLVYLQQTLGLTDDNIQPLVQKVKIQRLPTATQTPRRSSAATSASFQVSVPRDFSHEVMPQSTSVAQADGKRSNSEVPTVIHRNQKRYIQGTKKLKWWFPLAILTLGGTVAITSIVIFASLIPTDSTGSRSPLPTTNLGESEKPGYKSFLERGLAKRDKSDFQGAVSDFSKAIELKPDYADAYFHRGNARRVLVDSKGAADNKAAMVDYDQAIKLKPDYAEAYDSRSLIRGVLGDYEGATRDSETAVRLYKQQGKK